MEWLWTWKDSFSAACTCFCNFSCGCSTQSQHVFALSHFRSKSTTHPQATPQAARVCRGAEFCYLDPKSYALSTWL
eukprot:3940579-Rhodomonas_salina.1